MTYISMHLPKNTSQKELIPNTVVQAEFAGEEKIGCFHNVRMVLFPAFLMQTC